MSEEPQEDGLPEGYRSSESVPYVGYTSFLQRSGIPPYTDAGVVNPLPPVRKRRRPGCWIAISILVVLLLASATSFFVIRYINRSTPDKTLDAFCGALQQADYQSAYDQFSAQLQHTVSEAAFAASLSQDRVTACTHGTTGDSGNSVTNDLKLVHASKGINDDIVTLTRDSNNDWKIEDIFKQT